jgi:hypothetical protein
MASHRILYAGGDIYLPARLRNGLSGLDCFVVYSPVGVARTFIRSDIGYSLFLFDESEAGAELEAYTRSLEHREQTPVIIFKKSQGLGKLIDSIKRRVHTLPTTRAGAVRR